MKNIINQLISHKMKKLLLLLMLFTGIAKAQIVLGTPSTYYSCNSIYDLSTKTSEILAGNDSNLYSIAYFISNSDAVSNINVILNPTNYVSPSYNIQIVTARVWENANPGNFAVMDLLLDNNTPYYQDSYYYSLNIGIQDVPFDGFYTFDFTDNSNHILVDNPNCSVTFYPSQADALNNTNPIVNPSSYTNISINSQVIGYRITNTISGCFYVGTFNIVVVNEPIINFPDPIFKCRLINYTNVEGSFANDINGNIISIDANNDGEIEISEALAVYDLAVNGTFLSVIIGPIFDSMVGIEYFTNLRSLYCNNNHLTSLDVSALTNLTYFQCISNQLTNLNVTNLSNLNVLYCGANQFTNIDLTGLTNLHDFACSANQLSTLNLSPAINLKRLHINNNLFTNINLTGLDLEYLDIQYNQFTSFDVSNFSHLQIFLCTNNQLNSLNIGNLNNLTMLNSENNLLTSLDVSGCPNLQYFTCGYNQLQSLFMKKGINPFISFDFTNNLGLQYICTDETKVAEVYSKLSDYGNTNCVVNSYCSFVPGGNYNTITGKALFDANNNGCDANDPVQSKIKYKINDGSVLASSFTDSLGNYYFYTQSGSFEITPEVENPTWYAFSPATATITFLDNNNNTTIQNFCIAPVGLHNDLEVALMPISPARPGFDATYKVVFKNKGNQLNSGTVTLNYDDTILDFVSSTLNPSITATGLLTFQYTNLLPFESRSFIVTLNVNSPIEIPAVNIGTILNYTTTINPIGTDENPDDNTFVYNQIVVGSFDPNDITCLEGNFVDPSYIGKYLHYGVNFENTGNYPAENIVVKVIIDTTKYDMNSLQLMDTSHNSYTRITGNIAEFIFETINLDSGGHGNILFKIKTLNELSSGDMVNKRADIFFDYNAPIDTGMANTTFQTLSNGNFEIDDSISVYPNPTKSNININCQNTIKTIQLYDVQGRLLETKLVDDLQTSIDISEKSKGIYFLKITSDNGSKVVKVVKE
jgi:hypothetical protein